MVVSHDALAAARAQRTVRIRDGRIVEDRRDGESRDRRRPRRLAAAAAPSARNGRGSMTAPRSSRYRVGSSSRRRIPRRFRRPAANAGQTPARDERGLAWEPALVELRSLSRSRGSGPRRRLVIDELSRVFAAGKLTAVAGRSGTGKTTLLRLLAGLDLPDAGELSVDRQRLTDFTAERLRPAASRAHRLPPAGALPGRVPER